MPPSPLVVERPPRGDRRCRGATLEAAATSTQPRISHPPLVEIQALTGRDPARVEQLLEAAAAVLAEGLRMEAGNVFVTWTDLQPRRVLTGGEIRR